MCQPFFQDSVVRLSLFCLYLRPGIACQSKGREDNRCLLPVMPVCCPVLPWSPSVHEQSLNPEIDSPTSLTLFCSYSFLHFFHLFGYSLGGGLHTRLGTHVRARGQLLFNSLLPPYGRRETELQRLELRLSVLEVLSHLNIFLRTRCLKTLLMYIGFLELDATV